MLRNCGCLWSVVDHRLHLLTNEMPELWPGDQSEASSQHQAIRLWETLRGFEAGITEDKEWWFVDCGVMTTHQDITTPWSPLELEAHGGFEAGRCRQDIWRTGVRQLGNCGCDTQHQDIIYPSSHTHMYVGHGFLLENENIIWLKDSLIKHFLSFSF